MFIISGIFAIISGIFGLLLYIFSAVGLYTMSKRADVGPAWIAWIPVCQWFLIGKLIGNKIFGIPHADWILLIAPFIAAFFAGSEGFIPTVITLVVYVLEVAAYYKLFKVYAPNRAVLYTITGFIISPLLGLYVFLSRNNPRQISNVY